MEKKKICWARVLKNISYIMFQILISILFLIVFSLSYPLEKEAIKAKKDYYETNTFAENYARKIFESLSTVTYLKQNENTNAHSYYYVQTETIENNENVKSINYYTDYIGSNVLWLIIDNDTKKAYTNLDYSIDTSTIENIISKIMKNNYNWKYENEEIQTTVVKLSNENIEYIDSGLTKNNIQAK